VLNKYKVKYYSCPNCGYIQTEDPYWIDEAYANAIVSADTGIMVRNNQLNKITSTVVDKFFDSNKKFLDYGGGYGILTRQMRDLGFDFYWYDRYAENLVARGFEYDNQNIELITAFEVFEHLNKPLEEIANMIKISKNILFSTETYDEKFIPKPNEWWYYSLESGQHISFYSLKTIKYIADKFKLNYYTNGTNIHLITEKKIDETTFKEILLNYENILLEIKNKRISRTFSDMNYINLKNKNIKKLEGLKFDYYSSLPILKDRNIIIFGTGGLGRKINGYLGVEGITITYFSDNNKDNWKKKIDGIEVIKPEELLRFKNYIIVIGSSYYMEIYRQLEQMGIDKDNILYLNGIN
jgi:hypothetical protein